MPTILGGFHATLATEECARRADSVFAGDAETLWGAVVKDALTGKQLYCHQKWYRLQAACQLPAGEEAPSRGMLRAWPADAGDSADR